MTLLYARAPFQQLKAGAYDLALIDPPWKNQNRSVKGEKKSSVAQYGYMEFEDIYALPVRDLLKRDAVIVLCCTWPLLMWGGDVRRHYAGHDAGMSPQGKCLHRWRARYSTGGIWRKITKTGKIARGTRYRVWNVCDPFIIGIIGSPKTIGIENCFDGLRREHSRKPPELKAFCEAMMPGARRIELFSRESRKGWDTWGWQAGKFDPVVTLGAPANDDGAAA
jgi:N6-adenosine-specific RNA methylase IME4